MVCTMTNPIYYIYTIIPTWFIYVIYVHKNKIFILKLDFTWLFMGSEKSRERTINLRLINKINLFTCVQLTHVTSTIIFVYRFNVKIPCIQIGMSDTNSWVVSYDMLVDCLNSFRICFHPTYLWYGKFIQEKILVIYRIYRVK